jgi:FtsH-binding integral membrane protein
MNSQFSNTSPILKETNIVGSFFAQVYGWMVVGLLVTFVIAFGVMTLSSVNEDIFTFLVLLTPFVFIGQLILVLILSFAWRKLNFVMSSGLFLLYSASMGIFFGVIFLNYTIASIVVAIAATIATFLAMALYGYFTKQDLTRWGQIALFGLLGLIFATLINIVFTIFFNSLGQTFNWILTYVGIGIFMILIAYDSQRLKQMAAEAESSGMASKLAIQGALMLYLDFINLFIRLLAIFGKRR